jgi:hypothetical protein
MLGRPRWERRSGPVVGATLTLGLLVLAAVVVAAALVDEPVGLFTRDITTLSSEAGARLPPYAGALGLLTFMIWASAATLSAFVAFMRSDRDRRIWLLMFAGLLGLLTADDSLSIHEVIGPDLGIPELSWFVLYAAIGLSLSIMMLRRVQREGMDTSVVPFLLGGVLLAVSIAVDVSFKGQHLAEDGPKFLGALLWFTVPLLSLPPEVRELMRRTRRERTELQDVVND